MSISLGGTLLEACVLAVVSRGDAYGYSLTQSIRLQKEGFLTTYDSSFNGRNRRFYKITDEGRQKLSQYIGEWNTYKNNLDKIFSGGDINE